MPIETFGFPDSLNASNPPPSDGLVGGDDHIRGIKATIKSTFPNLTAAVTATAAQINQLATGIIQFAAGTAGAPSITFAAEQTLGFYRSAAGFVTFIGGRLLGNGTVPVGTVCDFFHDPGAGWYEANGQAVSRTGETAGLFDIYGTTYGAGNGTTTFNLPNVNDRYRRTAGGSLGGAGALVADAIASHSSSVSVSGADHTHGHNDPVHSHSNGWAVNRYGRIFIPGPNEYRAVTDSSGGNIWHSDSTSNVTNSGIGLIISNSGVLSMSGNATYSGASETRPKTIIVRTFIKA
jgi:microcystin-dependent protein